MMVEERASEGVREGGEGGRKRKGTVVAVGTQAVGTRTELVLRCVALCNMFGSACKFRKWRVTQDTRASATL